ncbi:hypothetical protein [Demequina sediminicola]|uniref:hypothetical protein n=1 Tax=Demequina sediminicola TaxID=1095026 RepID=UPI0007803E9D|nr:hypothetical protein [Demequina sediminicola]
MKITTLVAPFAAVAFAATLTACSNPIEDIANNAVEQAAEEAIGGGEADVDLNLDGAGANLPDGWPDDITLPDGTIDVSTTTGDGMMVSMSVADIASWEELNANLTAAGYAENPEVSMVVEDAEGGAFNTMLFEGNNYTVTSSVIGEPGEYILQVIVAKNATE